MSRGSAPSGRVCRVPHLTLEYSANLAAVDLQRVFDALHEELATLGIERDDCKSRAYRCDSYCVGSGAPERAFAHLTLALLDRRSDETQQAAGAMALAILQDAFAASERDCDVTVEIRMMRAAGYFKARVGTPTAASGPYR